jgi:hypothetical protein
VRASSRFGTPAAGCRREARAACSTASSGPRHRKSKDVDLASGRRVAQGVVDEVGEQDADLVLRRVKRRGLRLARLDDGAEARPASVDLGQLLLDCVADHVVLGTRTSSSDA